MLPQSGQTEKMHMSWNNWLIFLLQRMQAFHHLAAGGLGRKDQTLLQHFVSFLSNNYVCFSKIICSISKLVKVGQKIQ